MKNLAREVKEVLGDSGVTISTVSMFDNPLENEPDDLLIAIRRELDRA